MSGRSYLSIGDVLSLLREEFPDVTISKIRFLESQGLVDPERSPSGYRKFYDEDVARLRWVLRKQRDHFLPLKVIRDRLAAAGRGVPPDDEPVVNGEADWGDGEDAASTAAALREGAHGVVGAGMQVRNGAAASQQWSPEEGPGADEAEAVPVVAAARPAQPTPAGISALGAGVAPAAATASAATAVAERGPDAADEPSSQDAEPRVARHAARPGPARTGSEAAAHGARAASGAATGSSVSTGTAAAEVLSPSVSGVSLTLAELCAATGLTPESVASLEGLGLLAAMSIAGGTFYDEEALTIGKLVMEFGRYGVEPRHLRMYRNAADREVGLVEQVITPLLRQRNPEARQRAVDTAADLARLGQNMRASLVRSELRRQLGS